MRTTLVLLVGLAPAVLPAAPVPPRPLPFFPTRVGTSWVYDFEGKEFIETITDIRKIDNVTIAHINKHALNEKPDRAPRWEDVSVSDEGVATVADTLLPRSEAPIRWVKADARVGERWGVDTWFKVGDSNSMVKAVISYEGFEKVKAPAGEFLAMRIKLREVKGYPARERWYARGVGLVKQTDGQGNVLQVLKSFQLGKK